MSDRHTTKYIGGLGEDIAAEYLMRKGFTVISRNVSGKGYEIDIICRKNESVHFVEVKSVSYETIDILKNTVLHETWQPEDLVHRHKLRNIKRGIESWIIKHSYTGNVQIDVLVVRFVPRETYARVKYIENITD